MKAWRTHRYGKPTEVLQLDEVPIPDPGAGEVRVRVQAIPFNLNDLERITGGNMMVRPELPYSPGMEVMGVVDACGALFDRHRKHGDEELQVLATRELVIESVLLRHPGYSRGRIADPLDRSGLWNTQPV